MIHYEQMTHLQNDVFVANFVFISNYRNILRFNDLLGPLNFTIVKLKRRPAITCSASYGVDSCPFILVITHPQ